MRAGAKWAVMAGVLVALAGGGAWWQSKQGAQASVKPDESATPLVFAEREVVRAELRPLALQIAFSGPLVAPDSATVKAKAAGTLLDLAVSEGSRVRKGQALGRLDLADLNARLQERQAMVASAQATLAQAERAHGSNQHLAEQQFISPIALENSRAALNSARAQVGAAQAQADTIRIALREAALVAPIDGIVAKRLAVPGEKVAAEQPLLSIVDLRHLEMAGGVGTRDVARLQVGMPVRLQIEGEAQPVTGRLARIAPSADAGSRAIQVAVSLANPDERWRAGQFALAHVDLPSEAPVLAVPATALGAASGQEYVWTIEQGQLYRRTVVTGRRDASSGQVEVLQGLQPGTQVLAASYDNLREGRAARLGDAAAATAKPMAPASAASR